MFGAPFAYASFDADEYRTMLWRNGFKHIASVFDEPDARVHKVWTATKRDP